jgi:hypothetical protein
MIQLKVKTGHSEMNIYMLRAKVDMKNFIAGDTKECLIQMMTPMYKYEQGKQPVVDEVTIGRCAIFERKFGMNGNRSFYKVFKSIDDAGQYLEGSVKTS